MPAPKRAWIAASADSEKLISVETTLLRVADSSQQLFEAMLDRALDKPPRYQQERMLLIVNVDPE